MRYEFHEAPLCCAETRACACVPSAQDYRLLELPAECRPVLVFVNVKSGPQIGLTMRAKFLRLLHPLQARRRSGSHLLLIS